MSTTRPETDADLTGVLVQLMKGVVYRDTHERQWQHLLALRSQVRDHVAAFGLSAEIDEAEGYAYLHSVERDDDQEQLPRLVARRPLSFHVSLLLALLRKKLAEFDATSAESRLILTREQITEMLRVFLPESSNDVRLITGVNAHINKVVDLGFLTPLRGQPDSFEIRRIIKAFVDGQWLATLEQRLSEYRTELTGSEPADDQPADGGET